RGGLGGLGRGAGNGLVFQGLDAQGLRLHFADGLEVAAFRETRAGEEMAALAEPEPHRLAALFAGAGAGQGPGAFDLLALGVERVGDLAARIARAGQELAATAHADDEEAPAGLAFLLGHLGDVLLAVLGEPYLAFAGRELRAGEVLAEAALPDEHLL